MTHRSMTHLRRHLRRLPRQTGSRKAIRAEAEDSQWRNEWRPTTPLHRTAGAAGEGQSRGPATSRMTAGICNTDPDEEMAWPG